MNLHPLKDSLINELHNRPFPVVELPAQVSSLVFLHSGDRQAELDKLSELAQSYGMPAQQPMPIAITRALINLICAGNITMSFLPTQLSAAVSQSSLFVPLCFLC